MPELDALQKKLGSADFEVVALSLDRQGAETARKFLDDTKASNLKLYVDPSARALDAVKAPAVFSWLSKTGGVAATEMLRTFNCGVGMIAVVAAEDVERVGAVLAAEGESVFTLGRMVARTEGEAGTSYKGTLAL